MINPKKICWVLSFHEKAVQYEWIAEKALEDGLDISFLFLNPGDSHIETHMREKKIPCHRITYRGKNDIPVAIIKTANYFQRNKIKIVHAHLFDANMAGLTAARLCRIKKRIYTRHHSDLHHTYFPAAVKYDRYCNRIATDIVAISKIVEHVLIHREHVPVSKVHLIHHGFQLDSFQNISPSRIADVQRKYNPLNRHPVIGVISRYTGWKGIQYIIPAFKKIIEEYPQALLLLANANGDYKNQIQKLLQSIPTKNYLEIPFENDVASLYNLFDVFVHVPIAREAEAFGQIYVESLASGVPSVFTMSGIANEFIIDGQNALVAEFSNSESIYQSIKQILENKELKKRLVENGKKSVKDLFGIDKFYNQLKGLYQF